MDRDHPTRILGTPIQIAFVVRDVHQAAARFTSLFDVEPFGFEEWPPSGRPGFERIYRGKPAEYRAVLAFARWGPLEVELIENTEGDSDYADHLRKRGQGVHHLLFEVDDLDETIRLFAELGIVVTMSATGRRPGTRWVQFDTADLIGCCLEVRNRPQNQDVGRQ